MKAPSDNDGISLETLMRRAQQGDIESYTGLLKTITPVLRAFVVPRLGSVADAEDVVQNILLAIHRSGHTYDSDRPFKVWMFAIARHCLNEHLRKVYRRGRMPEINLDALAEEISAGDVTETRDRREYLYRILKILPERQRKIVVMMKIEGLSAEETAAALKMSVSAVKVAAHRAYKKLTAEAVKEEF